MSKNAHMSSGRRTGRPYPPVNWDGAAVLYHLGATLLDIAQLVGVSEMAVSKHARLHHWPARPRNWHFQRAALRRCATGEPPLPG